MDNNNIIIDEHPPKMLTEVNEDREEFFQEAEVYWNITKNN